MSCTLRGACRRRRDTVLAGARLDGEPARTDPAFNRAEPLDTPHTGVHGGLMKSRPRRGPARLSGKARAAVRILAGVILVVALIVVDAPSSRPTSAVHSCAGGFGSYGKHYQTCAAQVQFVAKTTSVN